MKNDVKKALRAALKDKKLISDIAKEVAVSHIRGTAYREADRLRAAEEAAEGEPENGKLDAEDAGEDAVPGPTAQVAAPPVRQRTTPADIAVRAARG